MYEFFTKVYITSFEIYLYNYASGFWNQWIYEDKLINCMVSAKCVPSILNFLFGHYFLLFRVVRIWSIWSGYVGWVAWNQPDHLVGVSVICLVAIGLLMPPLKILIKNLSKFTQKMDLTKILDKFNNGWSWPIFKDHSFILYTAENLITQSYNSPWILSKFKKQPAQKVAGNIWFGVT